MTVTLGPLIVEAANPVALERFWCSALGVVAFRRRLRIQPARGPKVVKNRVHVDVRVGSAEPEELAAWWATRVGADLRPGPDGTLRWLHGSAGWDDVVWE